MTEYGIVYNTTLNESLRELPAIPTVRFPDIHDFETIGLDEELVNLEAYGLAIDPQYSRQGIPGAMKTQYARETVAKMLARANSCLPKGYHLKVYDAWRPISVQQSLWDRFRAEMTSRHPDASEEEIDRLTAFFVSRPSHDILHPSLHSTGGAIDVTLIDDSGCEYAMGTGFDDFSDRAWTDHFEQHETDERFEAIKLNRRLLYHTMTSVGFTNLPSEWWHYDYGTKFWGHFLNQKALYRGILDANATA